MSIKFHHDTIDKTWFVTFTCFKWVPLFEITDSYDIVYNWFQLIREKQQADILGFVIMPNHVHIILQLNYTKSDLNLLISNAKRFMAYEIIKRLEKGKQQDLLFKLSKACTSKERYKGQRHKVFEPSFDAKPIYSEQFFLQKLDYIHRNPVRDKWNLSNNVIEYKHSSAGYYETGIPHQYALIKDFR